MMNPPRIQKYDDPDMDQVHALCDQLNECLVFLDVETTGVDILKDRVLQIYCKRYFPQSIIVETLYTLVNPVDPFVPPEGVHNITMDVVKDSPTFQQLVPTLQDILANSVVIGFNSESFDIPILREEFARCNSYFPHYSGSLDVYAIFTKFNPRTLKAAVKTYLGLEQVNAHNAKADTLDTIRVFNKQIAVHNILSMLDSTSSKPLHSLLDNCSFNQYCDAGKRFKRTIEGDFILTEGSLANMSVFSPFARPHLENYAANSPSLDTRLISKFFLDLPIQEVAK